MPNPSFDLRGMLPDVDAAMDRTYVIKTLRANDVVCAARASGRNAKVVIACVNGYSITLMPDAEIVGGVCQWTSMVMQRMDALKRLLSALQSRSGGVFLPTGPEKVWQIRAYVEKDGHGSTARDFECEASDPLEAAEKALQYFSNMLDIPLGFARRSRRRPTRG